MRSVAEIDPLPHSVLSTQYSVLRLAMGFLRLAVAALFVTGVFVLLVAVGRTPLVALFIGKDYLYTALVTHVVFALDIWLLSFMAVLWVLVAARLGRPFSFGRVWPGLTLGWFGAVLLVVVAVAGLGQPVLADYVPVLAHPLYFLGLFSFLVGIAFAAGSFVVTAWRCRSSLSLEGQALGIGATAYLAALAVLVAGGVRWGSADYPSMVWGGGHLFQLVNATGLVAVWLLMAPPAGRRARGLIRLSLFGFVPAVLAVVVYQVLSLRWDQVALVFWAGVGTPLVASWLVVVKTVLRQRLDGGFSARAANFLLFSLVLFAVGGLIALPGMGADTRVTAHYHATVGAVTMVFMGLSYRLLPQLGIELTWPRLGRLQPYLYGFGLLALVGGLFLAGEAGTARKIFEAISTNPALMFAAAIFGLGALATVAGGIAFVAGVGMSLLKAPSRARAAKEARLAVAPVGWVW